MLEVECYCTLARRSARALTEFYDDVLAPSGLKVTQLSLLRAIERLGGGSLTDLAEATGLDRSTLGRNLRVMEKSGLVRFSPTNDERMRVAELTPEARRAVEIASPLWAEAQARVADVVSGDMREKLRALAAAAKA